MDSSYTDSPVLDIATTEDGVATRLTVTGELDGITAETFQDRVLGVLDGSGPRRLEVDASGLTFLDSTGIRCLLTCGRYAESVGCRLVVVEASAIVHRVLDIVGVLDMLGLEPRNRTVTGPEGRSTRPSQPGSERLPRA
jgi:anti-anti-sigma factor